MLSAIERGTRGVKSDYVDAIDLALSTGGKLRRLLESMSSSAGTPSWFKNILELEQQATEFREYDPLLIPGPLQSADYARTILRDGRPDDTDDEIEALVEARMRRKDILSGDRPPIMLIVLDEIAVRRPIGGDGVMKDQLASLLDMAADARTVLQIVPFSTTRHPGLSGAFRLIIGPDVGEVVYLETALGGSVVDDVDATGRCSRTFGDLRGVALPPQQSRELVEKVIRGGF